MKKLLFAFALTGFIFSYQAHGQAYENAVGLRASWGFGGTFKHFLNESAAIEGILNYRSFGVLSINWSYVQVTGIYQVHNDLSQVFDGLQWYYGGGGFVGFWGGDFNNRIDGDQTYVGIVGNIGLDYAFPDIPLNLSVDWIPSISLAGGGGFLGEAGGLAIRYYF